MPISYSQASLGAHIEVPTLDELASIVIPRGTQHGSVFRIEGAGLPNLRTGRRGDVVVVVEIEVPKRLGPRQEELLRELAELEGEQGILPKKDGFWGKVKDLLGT
jgi:molecular chaperone DnaJ